jgi:hypothetical protein
MNVKVKEAVLLINYNIKIDSLADIPPLLISLMQRVEQLKTLQLTGEEKKMTVISVIQSQISDDLSVISDLVPLLIDTIISVDRGQLKINRMKGLGGLFSSCCIHT